MAPRHSNSLSGSFAGIGVLERTLPISLREHDATVQRFDRPSIVQNAVGKKIQQLRMRGRMAEGAEIVWRANESSSEMMLLHPIDHHATR